MPGQFIHYTAINESVVMITKCSMVMEYYGNYSICIGQTKHAMFYGEEVNHICSSTGSVRFFYMDITVATRK